MVKKISNESLKSVRENDYFKYKLRLQNRQLLNQLALTNLAYLLAGVIR